MRVSIVRMPRRSLGDAGRKVGRGADTQSFEPRPPSAYQLDTALWHAENFRQKST